MNDDNREILGRGLGELRLGAGFGDHVGLSRSLELYVDEILLWNSKINLVRGSERDIIIRHVLDSLGAVELLRREGVSACLDAGSGAGLPGIPLSLAIPGIRFTLLERSSRRAAFLTNVVALLGLPNVSVSCENVERHQGIYDAVVCRAFRPLHALHPMLNGIVRPGGIIVAYAGRTKEIEWPSESADYGATLYPLQIPFLDAERNLVVIRNGDASRQTDR